MLKWLSTIREGDIHQVKHLMDIFPRPISYCVVCGFIYLKLFKEPNQNDVREPISIYPLF